METAQPLVTNDAVILGMLALILGFVFYTESSEHPFWKKILHLRAGSAALLLPAFAAEHVQPWWTRSSRVSTSCRPGICCPRVWCY